MSWHTPERKIEQGLKLYLQTILGYELDGVQITTRFSNAELAEPRIEIVCESCSPDAPDAQYLTGNWTCNVRIMMVSHYASGTDAEAHDELCGIVLDQIIVTEGGEDDAFISAVNDCLGEDNIRLQWFKLGERTNRVDEHSLITEQNLEINIIPSR